MANSKQHNLSALGNTMVKSATPHWLMQRITAVILIPLSFKFIVFLDYCLNAPYEETKAWLASTSNLVWILVWLLAVFYHAALGLQVVIEDYVGNSSLQSLLIKAINLSFLILAATTLVFMFRSL